MRFPMKRDDVDKLLCALRGYEEAEENSDGSFTADIFEPEPAFTIELYPEKDGIEITAAALMEYNEEFEGWVMGERLRSEDELRPIAQRFVCAFLL